MKIEIILEDDEIRRWEVDPTFREKVKEHAKSMYDKADGTFFSQVSRVAVRVHNGGQVYTLDTPHCEEWEKPRHVW